MSQPTSVTEATRAAPRAKSPATKIDESSYESQFSKFGKFSVDRPQSTLRGVANFRSGAHLFNYDVEEARLEHVDFTVDKADRLSDEEAKELLHQIHVKAGFAGAEPKYMLAFDRALFVFHALNGGSELTSGDPFIRVTDFNPVPYQIVQEILAGRTRRFYRAFATVIRDTLKTICDNKENLPAYDDIRVQLQQVAHNRGLAAFPWCVADSIDAAILSSAERSAVQTSKAYVLGQANVASGGKSTQQVYAESFNRSQLTEAWLVWNLYSHSFP